jgi:hypothetical protein
VYTFPWFNPKFASEKRFPIINRKKNSMQTLPKAAYGGVNPAATISYCVAARRADFAIAKSGLKNQLTALIFLVYNKTDFKKVPVKNKYLTQEVA